MFATTYRSATELNSAMTRVYMYMMTAVLNTMLVGYAVSTSPELMQVLFGTGLKWVVLFAPLVMAFAIPFIIDSVDRTGALVTLHVFAALMGLSLSVIFKLYSSTSIVTAFMGAAILFGTMSFYGYFTKRSLESMGQYLFIALIAIILASIVNIFIGSSVMQMVISAISIVIFLGFTAYDTQTIRETLAENEPGNAAVMGALMLYLDFINIFINLLQLFGVAPSKDD